MKYRRANLISCMSVALGLLAPLGACGSDPGDGGTVADAGGGDGDGGGGSPCGFEARYLPFQDGYSWTYKVTDLGNGSVATKSQELTLVNDADLGMVLQQTTSKATGKTVSFLKVDGDAVVRYRQEDYDMLGALERTTFYDPGQSRLDEAANRISVGAAWDDSYTVTINDATGTQLSSTDRTEHWEVLADDATCSSPFGDLQCLQIRRQRTVGGISDKQFFFARGVGKIKEINATQVEELTACQ